MKTIKLRSFVLESRPSTCRAERLADWTFCQEGEFVLAGAEMNRRSLSFVHQVALSTGPEHTRELLVPRTDASEEGGGGGGVTYWYY